MRASRRLLRASSGRIELPNQRSITRPQIVPLCTLQTSARVHSQALLPNFLKGVVSLSNRQSEASHDRFVSLEEGPYMLNRLGLEVGRFLPRVYRDLSFGGYFS